MLCQPVSVNAILKHLFLSVKQMKLWAQDQDSLGSQVSAYVKPYNVAPTLPLGIKPLGISSIW